MGVVNTKATALTNLDASPPTLGRAPNAKGQPESVMATCAVAAADDDTSVFRFFRVPSNAIIHELMLWNDALTNGTDYDIGFLQTAANGGTATGADADLFADGMSMASARGATTTPPLSVLFYTLDHINCTKMVWELLALTTDSKRDYDLCITANTIGTVAGDMTLRLVYSV